MGLRFADERMDRVISLLLAVGVAVAAATVLAGGIAYLAGHGAEAPHYSLFRGEPSRLSTIGGIARGALALRPRAIIQFGILLLIATPIARVVFSAAALAAQRDALYVAATLIVLAILLANLLRGA
ncbi:MAG: DUF1634 domain-containing protein [Armatimonadota bacterium]